MKASGSSKDAADVTVPSVDKVKEALEKHPDKCTTEQQEAVSFLYNWPLMTLEKNLSKSEIMETQDLWTYLGNRWASSMGYALMLMESMSDLQNILINYQRGKDEKKAKTKMMTKQTEDKIANLYYSNLTYFANFKLTPKEGTKARFHAWDKFTGVAKEPRATNAQKRKSIDPQCSRKAKKEESAGEFKWPDVTRLLTVQTDAEAAALDLGMASPSDSDDDMDGFSAETAAKKPKLFAMI